MNRILTRVVWLEPPLAEIVNKDWVRYAKTWIGSETCVSPEGCVVASLPPRESEGTIGSKAEVDS